MADDARSDLPAHTHTHTHTHTQAHTHTHTRHTHTHTHTHRHAQARTYAHRGTHPRTGTGTLADRLGTLEFKLSCESLNSNGKRFHSFLGPYINS